MKLSEAVEIGLLAEAEHQKLIAEQYTAVHTHAAKIRMGVPSVLPFKPAGPSLLVGAEAAGLSTRRYHTAKHVVLAFKEDPEKYGAVLKKMDASDNPNRAWNEVRQLRLGGGRGSIRHEVMSKMKYRNPNDEMQKAVYTLDGICSVMEDLSVPMLDPEKVQEWSKQLKKFSRIINKTAKRISNEEV